MTDFVQSFSDQALIPPWQAIGSRHWAFVIDAAPGRMQDYLDSHFNAPGPDASPYQYKALNEHNYGILMVADHKDFACAGGARAGWDTVAHREVFWQFPAHRFRVDDNNISNDGEVVWIQPFYFDDSATVMFASREIWGSEKQMADIHFHQGSKPDDLDLDVSIQGFTKFNPRSRSHSIGVLHIRLQPGTEEVEFDKMTEKDGFPGFLATWLEQFPGLVISDKEPKAQASGIKIDTLKQFRDVFDMRKAAYRAIISSQANHSNFKNVRYFNGADVDLEFAWSDTMKEQFTRLFGLEEPDASEASFRFIGHDKEKDKDGSITDWNLPITKKDVLFAVAFESDATFEVLETLHTYGASIFSR